MDIFECTSVSAPDFTFESEESKRVACKGFAAIPDTMELHPSAPQPNPIWRGGITVLIAAFHLLTFNLQFVIRLKEILFGSCPSKQLYIKLHSIAMQGDRKGVETFLADHADKSCPAGYFFSQFLKIPQIYSHLPALLQGANICLEGDGGAFCQKWKLHSECYKRVSSHQYQGEGCFAIGHMLFWVDPQMNTRFQLEKSPLNGFLSSIEHTIDYLRYKRDNQQQGVAGVSSQTEDFCLRIKINPD